MLAIDTAYMLRLFMSGKQMVKKFEGGGWVLDRISGSHHIMKKGSYLASIPVHGSHDLKLGTEKSLLKLFKKAEDEDESD